MKHTENTLNARLKDHVYAHDVPKETDVRWNVRSKKRFRFLRLFSSIKILSAEFNRYEILLRTIEDRVQTLRSLGKVDAARRLEQQYIHLKVTDRWLICSLYRILFVEESILRIRREIPSLSTSLRFRTEIQSNGSNSSGNRRKYSQIGHSIGWCWCDSQSIGILFGNIDRRERPSPFDRRFRLFRNFLKLYQTSNPMWNTLCEQVERSPPNSKLSNRWNWIDASINWRTVTTLWAIE